MRKLVVDAGMQDRIRVESAGTIDYHAGSPPDRRMRSAAVRRGYVLEGSARQVVAEDFERFDLIVAMDRENLADLRLLASTNGCSHKIKLLSDFLPAGSVRDVPDPYYGGDRGFDHVLDMIEQACPEILSHLLADEAD